MKYELVELVVIFVISLQYDSIVGFGFAAVDVALL